MTRCDTGHHRASGNWVSHDPPWRMSIPLLRNRQIHRMISPGAAAVAPACSMKRRGIMTEASPRLSRRWLLGAGVAGAGALGGLPLLSGCSTSGGKSGGNDGPKPTGAPLQIGAEVSDGPTYKSGYVGPHATVKKPFGDGK